MVNKNSVAVNTDLSFLARTSPSALLVLVQHQMYHCGVWKSLQSVSIQKTYILAQALKM